MEESQVLMNLNMIIDQLRLMAETAEAAAKDNPDTAKDESGLDFWEGLALAGQGMNVGTYVYGIYRRDQAHMSDYVRVLRRARLTVD